MKKILLILIITTITLCGCATGNTSRSSSVGSVTKEADTTNVVTTAKGKTTQTSEAPIVLYRGIPLDTTDQNIDVKGLEGEIDILQNQKLYDKYEREYYLYSDGTYLGSGQGKITTETFASWQVYFPSISYDYEVAISQKYNPYPRQIVYSDSNFPKEFDGNSKFIASVNKQFNVNTKVKELCSVDLDADGENEYLAFVVDENNYFFAKCLLDSNYNIIAYITVFKEKYDEFKGLCDSFNIKDSGEIIDINNDGVMEILVKLPVVDDFDYKVFTYKDGKFNGDFITMGSLQP